MSETRFLIVDGNSLGCRAAFVPPILKNSKGRETGGTYRFFAMLNSVLKQVRPTHVLVAFDIARENFRTEIDPNYKANREVRSSDDSLYYQFEDIKTILTKIGVKHIGIYGFEADDVIGTYAANSAADQNFILTGDKDAFQLINDNTFVLFPLTGASNIHKYDKEEFTKKYDIDVSQFIDMKALMGDDGDNVKGIEKCGQKTAAKWLKAYGDLESIIKHADEIKGKIGENLRAWIPDADKTKQLVTIARDVPVPYDFKECEIDIQWENSLPVFKELECFSLIKQISGGKFYNVYKG